MDSAPLIISDTNVYPLSFYNFLFPLGEGKLVSPGFILTIDFKVKIIIDLAKIITVQYVHN